MCDNNFRLNCELFKVSLGANYILNPDPHKLPRTRNVIESESESDFHPGQARLYPGRIVCGGSWKLPRMTWLKYIFWHCLWHLPKTINTLRPQTRCWPCCSWWVWGQHGLIMPRNPLGLPPQKPAIDFVRPDFWAKAKGFLEISERFAGK